MISSARHLLPRRVDLWLQHRSFVARTRRSPLPPALSAAADLAGRRRLPADERVPVEAIEALRNELLHSPEALTVLDYGARHGTEDRTAEPVAAGVPCPMTIADPCRASMPPAWGDAAVRDRTRLPAIQVPGDGNVPGGLSAAYIGSALERNGRGRLITLEGAPTLAEVATRNFARLGLADIELRVGRFVDPLGGALADLAPLDFVFVDGHHDEAATKQYFARIRPRLAPGAIVVFDDIIWSDGMRRAWRDIAASGLQAYDLQQVGVCVHGNAPVT